MSEYLDIDRLGDVGLFVSHRLRCTLTLLYLVRVHGAWTAGTNEVWARPDYLPNASVSALVFSPREGLGRRPGKTLADWELNVPLYGHNKYLPTELRTGLSYLAHLDLRSVFTPEGRRPPPRSRVRGPRQR